MKIKFDSNLEYQNEAITSIVEIFKGQEICHSNFSVPALESKNSQLHLSQINMFSDDKNELDDIEISNMGFGNKLNLLQEELLENIRSVQLKNGLPQTECLESLNFTIEMETGTGKTYVYLKSIFELNKNYGFSKFIIVVPSIAIKEGVNKSIEMMDEHFKDLYENVKFEHFVYDSQKLGHVRNFATNDCIEIMIINIDAFRKSFNDSSEENKSNIIHRPHDKMNGAKPIDFIRSVNPIVIIDEPQSVDSTPKSKDAINSLNPLCCLRYSATHKDIYNLMYKLDSVDAYEKKLVKQIEVASISVKDGHNKAYLKLKSVSNKNNKITAKVEIDTIVSGKIKRNVKTIKQNDDLFEISGGRDVYSGYIVNDISCVEGEEYVDFTSQPEILELDSSIGEVNQIELKRLQIRKTIEEHFEKELRLREKDIKVLSLFFIDKVCNYRIYNDDGSISLGIYAQIFEEEAKKILKRPKYLKLYNEDVDGFIESIHDGYFAKDNKGRIKDSTGNNKDDESAFNLIMKKKEELLSFETSLRFIFSHSALREGWDNPNVFQICTLNETTATMKKRQEIGRGLRIAVNQSGERVHGFEVNTLTVMANESYEQFVELLQKEIEEDNNIKFGVLEEHTFSNLIKTNESGEKEYLGLESSKAILKHFKNLGYVNEKGKVQDLLRVALKDDKLSVPEEFSEQEEQIDKILRKLSGKLNVKDASKKKTISLNKEIFLGEEFKELWDKIKYKTTYRVDFDTKELIEKCSQEIKEKLIVGKTRFTYAKAETQISQGGVTAVEKSQSSHIYDVRDFKLPDIISYLQNETNLTRKTIVEILLKSEKLKSFTLNPQKFIDEVRKIILSSMKQILVNGIKYQKVGESDFYAQELFESEELTGYLEKNMVESHKSVYTHVVYDSDIERKFAEKFDLSEEVKVFAKLPDWFKIGTPLGSYNPDWAILLEVNGENKLYFVVESKGNILSESLRPVELAKISCGKKHFKALGEDITFAEASEFEQLEGLFSV